MMLRPALALVLLALAPFAAAQTFSAQVLPPRFEARAAEGTVYRNVIEIQNPSPAAVRFGIRTADWVLDEAGEAQFDYALAPGSCRPWVGLEAGEVRIEPNGRKRLRFEVQVPAGTPAGQCRFAIMIEGDPQRSGGMTVAGRIGVIIYLDIGDAAARLQVASARVAEVNGQALPLLTVRNEGNAHGRLQGLLDGIDAKGKRWTLAPVSHPILPGTEREIPLQPLAAGEGDPATPAWPLRLQGQLEWGRQRIAVPEVVGR